MKPVVLSATFLAALAIAATSALLVSSFSPASTAAGAGPAPEQPASAKASAAVVLDSGRAPVPIVRPPNEPARISAASAPAQAAVAEAPQAPLRSAPEPYAGPSRGAVPDRGDVAPTDPRLQSALASLPRGPDIRYWIVPLADGRVMVVAGRKDDPGPDGWGDRAPRHRRRALN